MTAAGPQPPIACTLDAAALGDREEEFRGLFAAALHHIERVDGCTARIALDPAFERQARDLFAREQRCCAFFAFAIAASCEVLVVEARVPADAAPALDYLLGLASES